jgi:hypothetical protein
MLLLKRLGTALVLFPFLFVVLFVGSLAVGGGIAGARAGDGNDDAKDFQSGFELGKRAGAAFGREYRGIIFLGALGISGLASLSISFTGILPWCRSNPQPPKLP